LKAYLLRRFIGLFPVLFISSFLIFLIIHLIPGDPAVLLVPEVPPPTKEDIDAMRALYGFDKPILEQYVIWLGNVLKGDLGQSISKPSFSVFELISSKLWVTMHVALAAFIVSILISVPLGLRMGLNPEGFLAKKFLGFYTGIGFAIPSFWLGILLILLFSVFLGLFPTSGFKSLTDGPLISLKYLFLPALCGGIPGSVIYTNFIAASVKEIRSKEYITFAIAKGLPYSLVILKHLLKNALIPVVTVAAATLGHTVAGAVITEKVFGIPGIGRLLVDAITARDYAVIQANFMVIIIFVMFANLVADILYGWLDPRIRLD
tara:strand:- start:59 stop:1015 length:957 start_codon:yes stop_codon:yes gene_type:complete